MAKDPAFLFYPGDWHLGTMHMTLLEKGAYMELLMLQFARGKFTEAHAKHMLGSSFDVVWPTVREKFVCDEVGFWNVRLQTEKEKRANFTESRRNNALNKEAAPKTPKDTHKHVQQHKQKHMPKHMEDENTNVIETVTTVFNGQKFFQKWDEWKRYLQTEKRKKIKTIEQENRQLKALEKLSLENEETAIAILEQSMVNSWTGLFDVKKAVQPNEPTTDFNFKLITKKQ